MRTTRSSSNVLDRTLYIAPSSMQASSKKRSSSNGLDGMPGRLAAAAVAAASSSPKVLLQSCLRLPRSRGSRMLLLVSLVVGGLLASSMTLLHHSSSSGFEQSVSRSIQAKLRAASAADAAHETQQQQQTSSKEPQQQRHRWRWKFTRKKAAAPPATAAQSELSPAGGAAASLSLPANLATQLEKQPAAVVTGAAPYQEAAAAAAAVTAQPEDVSLILAAVGQVDTRQQQQQQQQQETQPLPAGVQDGVDPADATSVYIQQRGVQPVRLRHPLWWHGPMWAGSGYGSEAVNFVLSLLRTGRLAPADIWSYHHGDTWREHVVNSFSTEDRTELEYLQSLPVKYRHTRSAVVVCHSVPVNWAFPEPMWAAGASCPPNPKEFAWVYSVGRTMFETDRLPAVFVPRLNAMTEVWVPSEWQRQSFIQSGVDPSKLVVVPEGVNTSLFDPDLYTPLPLRGKAQLVFGRHWEVKLGQEATAVLRAGSADSAQSATEPSVADPASGIIAAAAAAEDLSGASTGPSTGAAAAGLRKPGVGAATDSAQRALRQATHSSSYDSSSSSSKSSAAGSSRGSTAGPGSAVRQPFRFISTFKWEQRKGWDILLQAYLTAFSADDDVELYILTQPFAKSGSSFKQKMRGWANKLNITHSGGGGRSLLGSTAQQLQHEQQLGSEQQGAVHDDAALAAHVGDVMQQIKDFAGQLPHRQQPQQGVTSPAAAQAGVGHGSATAAQRRLQALSARAAGISRLHQQQQQQQQQQQPAVTRTGPAPPAPNATTTQAAAVAALKKAFAAEAAAARHPTLYVVNSHISDADFPRFYKAGDAFVLPSRGEGWGRPHVEAMSMGLPVISTNWSGITAYLDESCGYPLAIDGLVPVSGNGDEIVWWFRGLKWAQPSVTHLAQLMRRVYENRVEAAAKGAAGRARMVERYSPAAIADVLVRELQRIQDRVP